MRTAEEILAANKKYREHSLQRHSAVLESMEEYAAQFKYDFSKTCECENSLGETMCCNNCGLPTTTASRQRVTRNILKDFFDFIFTSDGVKTSPAHREKKIDEYLSSHASQFQSAPLPDISDEDMWVSVADEMPEDGTTVLVFSKYTDPNKVFSAIVHNKDNDGRFQNGTSYYWAGTEITHWMPLPHPPKNQTQNS